MKLSTFALSGNQNIWGTQWKRTPSEAPNIKHENLFPKVSIIELPRPQLSLSRSDCSRKLLSVIVTYHSDRLVNRKQLHIKQELLSSIPEEGYQKRNHFFYSSLKDKQSLEKKMVKFITTGKKSLIKQEFDEVYADHLKLQVCSSVQLLLFNTKKELSCHSLCLFR